MDLFLRDISKTLSITWNILINDLNNTFTYNPYCKSDNCYEVFKHIIVSLITENEIILLDSDFTENELINLTGISTYEHFTIPVRLNIKFKSKDQLIKKLRDTGSKWKITLFTSGTTGIPKKVIHDFKSIARFVKYSERNLQSIWGFAYNPTHMAGIQVYLQALLNQNSIINLFGLPPEKILLEIKTNHITHISATPTFYMFLLSSNEVFESVLRITSGGEKFNSNTMQQLKKNFPNAKITNVYASTETGTLFASHDDIFSVNKELEQLIKIDNNELLIHKSLLGAADMNIGDWYNTGDLVEVISNYPLQFRFILRKSDMINVGGYKVNPQEIEETLLSLSGIKAVRVFPKRNSVLGNIICCEVVLENRQLEESTIRMFLQTKLQEYKIPRVIKFVDKLSITRSGKLKRN